MQGIRQTDSLLVRPFTAERFGAARRQPSLAETQARLAIGIMNTRGVEDHEKIRQIQTMLDQGLDIKNAPGFLIDTLYAVSLKECGPKVFQFVVDKGANIYEQDAKGMTVVHHIVKMPFPPMGLLTIVLNADEKQEKRLANLPDKNLFTPLHHAARKGYLGAIKRLLEHHGDPTLKTNRNQDALQLAILSRKADAIEEIRTAIAARQS
jgi:ankyrin repeat protein